MTAVAVSTAVLVGAILTLCVTTALTSLALPAITLFRRRRPPARSTGHPAAPVRRPVTGWAATLPAHVPIVPPAIELGPAPRPDHTPTDRRPSPGDVSDAEALIERLLDQHPERLAELITLWLHEDDPAHHPKDRP